MKSLIKSDYYNTQDVFYNLSNYSSPYVIKIPKNQGSNTAYDIIYDIPSLLSDSRIKQNDYFSIYALTDGTLDINLSNITTIGNFEYRINDSDGQKVTGNVSNINITKSDVINFRANMCVFNRSQFYYKLFNTTFYYAIFGNINSLVYSDNGNGECLPYTTPNLFKGLLASQDTLISAVHLYMPTSCTPEATYCFYGMFYNCKNLIDGPTIPELNSDYCASNMFYGCKSLRYYNHTINVISGAHCCDSMFYDSGIVGMPYIIEVANGTSKSYCYYNMFYGCNNLSSPSYGNNALQIYFNDSYKCTGMFMECTNLRSAPNIHGYVGEGACSYMFSGCTKLKLNENIFRDVTNISRYSFQGMFENCNSIKIAYAPYVNGGDFSYETMYKSCKSLLKAYVYGYSLAYATCSEMFSGCTSLQEAGLYPKSIELRPGSPGYFSYNSIFSNCNSLQKVYCLAENLTTGTMSYIYFLPNTGGTLYGPGNGKEEGLNGGTLSNTIQTDTSFLTSNENYYSMLYSKPNDIENQSHLNGFFNELSNYNGGYIYASTSNIVGKCTGNQTGASENLTTSYTLHSENSSITITQVLDFDTNEYTYSITFDNITTEDFNSEDFYCYDVTTFNDLYYSVTE